MAEGNTENNSNRGLIATLAVLCVMIVGLVIAIVVVNMSGEVVDDTIDEEMSEIDFQVIDDITRDTGEIERAYNDDGDLGKAISAYRERINAAISSGKSWVAARYLIGEASFLDAFAGATCEESLAVIKNADLSAYNSQDLANIYFYAKDFSEACGDEALIREWDERYQSIIDKGVSNAQ